MESVNEQWAGIGKSAAFLEVIEQAERFADIPRPILLRGERGTGKELIARFIHRQSDRADKPYLVLNCAAFNDELFLADMFGHEPGAFTGAVERKIGHLERADGGTLFLDEVANLSCRAQEMLLRVIEYQNFERVGGTESIEVDVRILAATNARLEKMMECGEFLRDLYDRVCFAEITLPPLRKRREDIPLLIDHFIKELHGEIPDLEGCAFMPAAMKDLMAYHWPGNIRQLKNVIERLYVADKDRVIHASELPLEMTATDPIRGSFHERVKAYEKSLLLGALKDAGGNQREAAKRLGLTYDQFRHYYRKYRLAELMA
jgi:DNA-binding NtrC family response regulator